MNELPEKWCIKPANEAEGLVVRKFINDVIGESYYGTYYTTNYYWHFPSYDKEHDFCYTSPKTGYRVIEFAEFEEIVSEKNRDYGYLTKLLKKYGIR